MASDYFDRTVQLPSLEQITRALLYAFLFTVPFERALMLPGLGTISRAMGLLLVPCALLSLVSRGRLRGLLPVHYLMLLFLTWVGLSILWTASPQATRERFFTEIQCFLIVILIWQFASRAQHTRRCMQAYVLGTFISSASTILRFLEHRSTSWARYSAGGFDPNDLSLTLALTIPLSYYLFLGAKLPFALVWLIQIAMALLASLLTASRMGAVTSALALTIVLLSLSKLNPKQIAVLGALGLAAIPAVFTFVPVSSWARLLTIEKEVKTGNLNDRTAIWSAGFQAFSERPIAGIGAGSFPEATDRLLSYPQAGHMYVAHNTFISVLTELGLVGLILFLGILSYSAGPLFGLPSIEQKVWLLTFLLWVIGVSTLTWEHRKPTWVLLAFMISMRRYALRPRNAKSFCGEQAVSALR